jgi:hypothetical protein
MKLVCDPDCVGIDLAGANLSQGALFLFNIEDANLRGGTSSSP